MKSTGAWFTSSVYAQVFHNFCSKQPKKSASFLGVWGCLEVEIKRVKIAQGFGEIIRIIYGGESDNRPIRKTLSYVNEIK